MRKREREKGNDWQGPAFLTPGPASGHFFSTQSLEQKEGGPVASWGSLLCTAATPLSMAAISQRLGDMTPSVIKGLLIVL